MAEFVTAYNVRGEKVRVPAHFFDVPSLSKGLTKNPPRQKANSKAEKAGTPKRSPRKRATKKTTATARAAATTRAPAAGDEKE